MGNLRLWVIRMARLGMPKHQIAVKLGLSLEDLRLTFAQDINQVTFFTHLRILETLERLASSGHHPGATIFWVKHVCPGFRSQSESKKSPESTDDTEQYHTGPIDPNSFIVTGPNGERKGDKAA